MASTLEMWRKWRQYLAQKEPAARTAIQSVRDPEQRAALAYLREHAASEVL